MTFNGFNIPQELSALYAKPDDISILVGKNGSGKSRLLSELAKYYTFSKKRVIAISNSIHDKFPDKGGDLHLLRDRSGRRKVKQSIKGALLNILPKDVSRLKSISQALAYVGYDPIIGFENVDIDPDVLNRINDSRLPSQELDELRSLLFKLRSFNENMIWISWEEYSFREFNKAALIQLLKWEPLLKHWRLIPSLELYLSKNGQTIKLYDASSGELSFISSLLYISTTINENTVVLIDEPENSLHPIWQKDYLKTVLDLFYYYQPKIVAATHSALVVTGTEVANKYTNVFIMRNYNLERKSSDLVNIEEAFMDYFDLVTPQNRFLSEHLVGRLNALAERRITLSELLLDIDNFKRESFDEKQIKAIEGIRQLAINLNDQIRGNA